MMVMYWLACTLIMILLDNYLNIPIHIAWVCGVFMGIVFVHLINYLENRTKKIISIDPVSESDVVEK